MARIKKYFDQKGDLRWAQGKARDIYKDNALGGLHQVHIRILGEGNRWYSQITARHLASFALGEEPSAKSVEEMVSKLPPFGQWEFVLTESDGKMGFLAHEISGDRMVEAVVLEGLLKIPYPSYEAYHQAVACAIEAQHRHLFFPEP